ncbi:MAG: class F sortase [Ornithinimicrobium sp.]
MSSPVPVGGEDATRDSTEPGSVVDADRHRGGRGRRGWLAPVTACVLALTGAGLLTAAAVTQEGPPPQVPLAQVEGSVSGAEAPGAQAASERGAQARASDQSSVASPDRAAEIPPSRVAAESEQQMRPAFVPSAAVAPPQSLTVPSLDIETTLPSLGLDRHGVLEVPKDAAEAGWFALGTAPGANGAAVIAGHVDSEDGPGVFYRLAELARGAEIWVERSDGTTAVFAVDDVVSYPKDELPTAEVYASTSATLRLITCGGLWDGDEDGYRDNVVAYATLVDTR